MVGENMKNSGNSLTANRLRDLLSSPEGERLLRLLRADGGRGMRAAAEALRRGDAAGAKEALSGLLSEDEAEALGGGLQKRL